MEYLDIVNENDEIVSREERDLAHERYLLHRVVHIIIVNEKNKVLLQLRKSTKKLYPLFWISSVAGHVSSGDTPENTAYKEMKEELGIRIKLEFIGKCPIRDHLENEIVYFFFGKSNGPFNFDKKEIEKIDFFDIRELESKSKRMKITPQTIKALELISNKI